MCLAYACFANPVVPISSSLLLPTDCAGLSRVTCRLDHYQEDYSQHIDPYTGVAAVASFPCCLVSYQSPEMRLTFPIMSNGSLLHLQTGSTQMSQASRIVRAIYRGRSWLLR